MGLMKSSGGGEIVQVQGGHIVRSTGRKDRHSKVYTSKGPRDRRVRLSAHTAIQFYDVQDRLGFDRPSKAVDWLIKKAKSSIDKLAELPPWEPNTVPPLEISPSNGNVNSTEELATTGEQRGSESPNDGYDFSIHRQASLDSRSVTAAAVPCSSSLFPPQIDAEPFFSTSSAVAATSSINFDDYRSSNNQDLGLSLHPFQAPNFVQQHGDHINQAAIFPMTTDYPRFMFNPPPPLTQPFFVGHTQSSPGFLQRGTLQSSFAPSFRSFEEFQPMDSSSSSAHQHHDRSHPHGMHHHQPSMVGGRFMPDSGLPGFCIQTQIQPGDEHGRTTSGRPSSSASCH